MLPPGLYVKAARFDFDYGRFLVEWLRVICASGLGAPRPDRKRALCLPDHDCDDQIRDYFGEGVALPKARRLVLEYGNTARGGSTKRPRPSAIESSGRATDCALTPSSREVE